MLNRMGQFPHIPVRKSIAAKVKGRVAGSARLGLKSSPANNSTHAEQELTAHTGPGILCPPGPESNGHLSYLGKSGVPPFISNRN